MQPEVEKNPIDGVLVVDKPEGPTSHTVVAQARRYFGQSRVGHAGTLDPFASGVLILLLGEATKLSPYLTQANKRYRATVRFGWSTDSLDRTGQIVDRVEPGRAFPGVAELERALDQERGRREQIPPRVSAIKIEGQRAYRLARAAKEFTLLPRPVCVQHLTLLAQGEAAIDLELDVSKGYYVRSLARDLGTELEVPAHLASLRRIASGCFTLAESCAWPPTDALLTRQKVISPSEAIQRAMPCARLTAVGVHKAQRGQPVEDTDFLQLPVDPELPTGWLDPSGALVAIGRREASHFRVSRGFSTA